MKFSRRTVSAGLMASAASLLAPPLKAAGLAPVGGAARDLAVDDPCLIQWKGSAPVFIMHEATGAMFRPGAADELIFAGVWAGYAPPYMLAMRNVRGELIQIAPPAANKAPPDGRAPETREILRAAKRVVKMCLSRRNASDVWLMARPRLAGGNEIAVAPRSGFGGPEGLSYPSELRAKIPRGFAA